LRSSGSSTATAISCGRIAEEKAAEAERSAYDVLAQAIEHGLMRREERERNFRGRNGGRSDQTGHLASGTREVGELPSSA
jgi:hypothetical protein